MSISAKFDASRFNRGVDRLAEHSKRDGKTLLKEQGRGFTKRAIDLTPPSQGKANSQSKKRGEDAVTADLRRIMTPKPRSYLEYVQKIAGTDRVAAQVLRRKDGTPYLIDYDVILWSRDALTAWHEKRRRKSDGRVRRTNRDVTTGRKKTDGADMAFVPDSNFKWFLKRVKERVGLLAGGFNAAVAALGVRGVPQWIKRHGTGRGDVEIETAGKAMKITITNDVRFGNTVRGFPGRIQRALNDQARAMERRVAEYLAKIGRNSGIR
ncbi:hypothetical protein ACXR0O_19195 [Verrucomicrobiota bacterium sgz303538]